MSFFYKLSLKHTIIGISVFFTFIVTVIVASFSYYSFNTTLEKNLVQSTTFNLYLVGENIAKDMLPIISLADWTSNSSYLSDYVELSSVYGLKKADYMANNSLDAKIEFEDSKSKLRSQSLISWDRLQEEYRNTDNNVFINRIVVGNETDQYLQIAPISSSYAKNITEYIRSQAFFEPQLNKDILQWTGLSESQLTYDESITVIPIVRPILHVYTQDIVGWSYIEVSDRIIINAFKKYNIPQDSVLYFSINNHVYQLKDDQLIPIHDSNLISSISSHHNDQSYDFTNAEGHTAKAVQIETSIDGWAITQTLSSIQLKQQRNVYFTMLLFITFIVLFLGLSLTYILSHKINHPLNLLLKKMQLISKGDFSKDSSIEWDNELGIIGKGINRLAEDVMILMDKKIEDEKVKAQLEYQILQRQINPHFLYNTLNSIKWMATLQNAEGIAEMTTALSKLLRTVSKETSETHTLKSEMELLNHYFTIQKFRYGGSIDMYYRIDNPSLTNCQVPFFSLQPIVENAIFHGIEPKASSGNITIHVYQKKEQDDLLFIDIEDDGIGMSNQDIDNIYSEYNKTHQEFFKKIGINNVHQRIQHIFGNSYGISIKSQPNIGTTMSIQLPIVKE